MANDSYKIQPSDMTGHLVSDLDDQPIIGASALKAKFDDLTKNVVVPKFNTLADEYCTKAYADNLVIVAGAGDMAKSVYDTDDDGTVNSADTAAVADALDIDGNSVSGDNIYFAPTSKASYVTVSLDSASWSGAEAPYTQTVSATGVTATDILFIEPQYLTTNTNSVNVSYKEAYNCIDYAEVVTSGSITFYCYEDKPETTLPLVIRILR